MIEIVCAAAQDAEEVVVAALQWTEIRQRAEMPFADQRGAVAHLLQQRWQGGVARGRPNSAGPGAEMGSSSPTANRLIAPGDQRHACCRAVGGMEYRCVNLQSLDGQPVDVGRRIVALTVAAHIGVAEVIRHDEDDVRIGRLSPGGRPRPTPASANEIAAVVWTNRRRETCSVAPGRSSSQAASGRSRNESTGWQAKSSSGQREDPMAAAAPSEWAFFFPYRPACFPRSCRAVLAR